MFFTPVPTKYLYGYLGISYVDFVIQILKKTVKLESKAVVGRREA